MAPTRGIPAWACPLCAGLFTFRCMDEINDTVSDMPSALTEGYSLIHILRKKKMSEIKSRARTQTVLERST